MTPEVPAGQERYTWAQRFAQLSQDLAAEPEPEPTLERIVHAAMETIAGVDECGVSLRHRDGSIETPAATSPLARRLDDLQYELNEGPCLDTVWTLDTHVIRDLRTETRWPAWCARAAQLGIRSALSVRIQTQDDVIGALNLAARNPDAFDHTDVALASIFARHAANALAFANQTSQLNAALHTRQAIGAAQGMLMQRYGLTLDQAFEVLRRYSTENNIKLRDLAQRLIAAGPITTDLAPVINGAPPGTDHTGHAVS